MAYRYQLNTLETRELNMNWKLSSRWQVNAHHLYDMRDKHIVENLFGVNYESCCWSLGLSAKERFLTTSNTDKGIYLLLTLKGLGGFGFQQ
jgi:LPS-assembly protein